MVETSLLTRSFEKTIQKYQTRFPIFRSFSLVIKNGSFCRKSTLLPRLKRKKHFSPSFQPKNTGRAVETERQEETERKRVTERGRDCEKHRDSDKKTERNSEIERQVDNERLRDKNRESIITFFILKSLTEINENKHN